MTSEELKKRTKAFALRCVKLAGTFPKDNAGNVISRQLIRSSTSVAANYRASCSARSHADFLNKLGIVEEEADETIFWIDFAPEAGLVKFELVDQLIKEGKEILAIIIASQKTAKARRKTAKNQTIQPKA